jgi:hypothetical protein
MVKAGKMRWAGHVARMGETSNAYRLLVGTPEGRRPLGRPRRWWLDNIRTDLVEVGWGNVNWIGLAKDGDRRTLVNSVLNLVECPKTRDLSSSAQLHVYFEN